MGEAQLWQRLTKDSENNSTFRNAGCSVDSDPKDYYFGRITIFGDCRLNRCKHRESLEKFTQDLRALAWPNNLFEIAESECTAPAQIAFNSIHLDARARIFSQRSYFQASQRVTMDAVVIKVVIDRSDIGFSIGNATEPGDS
jgi:hypothetical protein